MFFCIGISYGEEIDQISIGIAKQHRSCPPGLIRWFQDKFAYEIVESIALPIDIVHLEI